MAGALVVVFNSFGVPAYAHGIGCYSRASLEHTTRESDDGGADLVGDASATRDREALTKPVQGLLSAIFASTRSHTSGTTNLGVLRTGVGSLICFYGAASPPSTTAKVATVRNKIGHLRGGGGAELEDDLLIAIVLKQPGEDEVAAGSTRVPIQLQDDAAIALAALALNAVVMFVGWVVAEDPARMRDASTHAALAHGLRPVLDALLSPFARRPPGARATASDHLHTAVTVPLPLAARAEIERVATIQQDAEQLNKMCKEFCLKGGEKDCLGAAMIVVSQPEVKGSAASSDEAIGRVRLLAASAEWMDRLTAGESHTLILAAATSRSKKNANDPTSADIFLPHFTTSIGAGRIQFRMITVPVRLGAGARSDTGETVLVTFVCNKAEPSVDHLANTAVPAVIAPERAEWLRNIVQGTSALSTPIARDVQSSFSDDILAILLRTRKHVKLIGGRPTVTAAARYAQVVFWERERESSDRTGNAIASFMMASPSTRKTLTDILPDVLIVPVKPDVPRGTPHLTAEVLVRGTMPAVARNTLSKQAADALANATRRIWSR